MHRLFADWYKPADLNPTAELLNARWSGVEFTLTKLDRDMVLQLTRISFALPQPAASTSDTDGLANAFKVSTIGLMEPREIGQADPRVGGASHASFGA